MLLFHSKKVEGEFDKAPVALRLITEALAIEHLYPPMIFRVLARTNFEKGVHSTGLALDLYFLSGPERELEEAVKRINARFPRVAKIIAEPASLPSGGRVDRAHVHIQIPFDWKADPRAFLKAYGFLQNIP